MVSDCDGAFTYAPNTSYTHTDGTTVSKDFLIIYKITLTANQGHQLFLTGYSELLPSGFGHDFRHNNPSAGGELVFKQPKMNGYSQFSANRINQHSPNRSIASPGLYAVGYTIEFLQELEGDSVLPDNPAIWETEPKENTPLDIYYEASGLNPIALQQDTKHLAIPILSLIHI